jgi:ubiquinone/menaquinone biosynthesis C-methylase UbiE
MTSNPQAAVPKQAGRQIARDRERILSDNIDLHRRVATVYDRLHPHMRNGYEQWLQRRDIRRMMEAVGSHGDVRVLDIGCGTGNLTLGFLARGARVTAIDMSREMLGVLSSKLAATSWSASCVLLQADVDTYLANHRDDTFDIISMSSVAHHLADYLATLDALADRLALDGYLYLIHEPAHRSEMTSTALALRRLWSVMPRGGDRLLRRVTTNAELHRSWEAEDTRFADYHYHRDGVSVTAITSRLAARGYRLVDVSRYNAHGSSLVSWLDNYWFSHLRYEQFQRTYFRALWRRSSDRA